MFNIWFEYLWKCGIFKGKITKKKLLQLNYFTYFLSVLMEMFEFEDKPESLNIQLLMFYKLLCGVFGVKKKDDKYIVCRITRGEGLDTDGLPLFYNLFTFNETHFNKCKDKEDFIIGWNNNIKTSELLTIIDYAEMCNNTEITEKAILKNGRLFNVFEVEDGRQKTEIENMIKKSDDGLSYGIIQHGDKWNEVVKNAKDGFLCHKLTDDEAIRGLSYSSTYFNDIIKRFFFFYGLPMSNGTKQAQQSIEEIQSNDSASSVYCNQMLKCMEEFVNNFNELYNEHMTVRFSDSWQQNIQAVKEESEETDDFSQLKMESEDDEDVE